MEYHDPILENLNDEQRRAVLQKDGPVLIVAGAGSGKTRVLTSRLALLLRDGVEPGQILALTFTKKAAGEMRNRISEMVGDTARFIMMGTFHSVFVKFLRQWHAHIGFPDNFTIYDQEDAQNCLKNVIGETLFGLQWNDKELLRAMSKEDKEDRKILLEKYNVRDISHKISLLKNEYILPKEYMNDQERIAIDELKGTPLFGQIYETYMKRCRKAGAMDFDDILVYTCFLILKYNDIADLIAYRYRYILVDEYQDTNRIQYMVIHRLSQAWKNITVVGDDSQSVYAFRGAQISNIFNFQEDYPKYRKFKLETNYRSTNQIVEASNRLIEHNERRIPKVCHASRGEGEPIKLKVLDGNRQEARYIASIIGLRHKEGTPYNDFAVLYRTNAQSRELEDAFIKERIPYIIYSGMSFFQRQEVKDVIAYFRLVTNHNDDEAFRRICNRPTRSISDATLSTLMARASEKECSIFETASEVGYDPGTLKTPAVKGVCAFVNLIETLEKKTRGLDCLEAAKIIIEETGIYTYYDKETDDDGKKRSNNIQELVNGISHYLEDQYAPDLDDIPSIYLADWLENISLMSAADKEDKELKDKVSLMTSHCSKGLEFPVVFVAGVEEGLFPCVKINRHTQAELEEERRLFYVSITRAMNELILTTCNTRYKYGRKEDEVPSRFITEMTLKK